MIASRKIDKLTKAAEEMKLCTKHPANLHYMKCNIREEESVNIF